MLKRIKEVGWTVGEREKWQFSRRKKESGKKLRSRVVIFTKISLCSKCYNFQTVAPI